jgi:uncharacterized Rmd1/YagE family protein
MSNVISIQISDNIDIKQFKSIFTSELIHSESDELFYKIENEKYIYIFKYGVVFFYNLDEIKISEFLKLISQYSKNFFEAKLREEFQIETNAKQNKFGYNKVELTTNDLDAIRLVMLNVSQSVALDYFAEQTNALLEETNQFTANLEKTGSIKMSSRKLKKFIGKTLNLKNIIAQNLYIFDSTPATWNNENLDKIDVELKRIFDLKSRHKFIYEELQIVKENLDLFKDFMLHNQSNFLEWIIIILILVEVFNLFIEKLL